MNIKELSIGDWARHTFYEENVRIARIDGDSERVLAERGKMSISCHLNHFEPIPLTPEILENNGCLHTAENRILCDWFDGRITVRKYNNREWYELFVGSNQMKFKLMFVHQLQRAMNLAGIEKEIIL